MVLQETQRESTSLGRGSWSQGTSPWVWSNGRWRGGKCWRIALACGGEAEVGQAKERQARYGREGQGSENRKHWSERGGGGGGEG